MAITDKKTGVWGLDQTFNKINQGSIWDYSGAPALHFWNYNSWGKFGLNYVGSPGNPSSLSGNRASSPIQIPDSSNWKFPKSSLNNPWFARTDGTMWAMGSNTYGNLGQNDRTSYSSPVQVGGGTDWDESYESSFAGSGIKTDGTLWICGRNRYGVLGLNQAHDARISSPTQIPGSWDHISTHQHAAGVKTDGTLWVWGSNLSGKLGINQPDNSHRSSPVQIPGTNWAGVRSGTNISVATKTDGTLWAWGGNSIGGLGQNDTVQRSSPVQIPGTTWPTDRTQFVANDINMFAVKTDGTLWCCGNNNSGVLGQNQSQPSLSGYSSPVQIPGTTWSRVSGSGDNNNIQATKTDNTLWGWGNASDGPINSNAQYSSPIQVPGIWDYRYLQSGTVSAAIQIQ